MDKDSKLLWEAYLTEAEKMLERIEELKEMQPLVLCCRSGQRSGKALGYLKFQGLEEVT